MKVPDTIRTFCPYCRKHTEHAVKKVIYMTSPPKRGSMTAGQRRFEKKIKGYTSKVGETPKKYKNRHKNVLLLECGECHKKQQRSLGFRTRKRAEIKRG